MKKWFNFTARIKDGQMCTFTVEVDTSDQRTVGPIDCCVTAASTNFWREYFDARGKDVDRVAKITPVHAVIPAAIPKSRKSKIDPEVANINEVQANG